MLGRAAKRDASARSSSGTLVPVSADLRTSAAYTSSSTWIRTVFGMSHVRARAQVGYHDTELGGGATLIGWTRIVFFVVASGTVAEPKVVV